ncbi:ketoacyl-ACP synthase III [Weeksellaceae bacterium TAE3-ERU29]|nr:ketoacyl-ACP synthase III [Weeksellaceae bacterium TAE3-ERU29]
MRNAVIKGSGHFLPERIVKNTDFLNYEFYDDKGEKITKPNEEVIEKFKEITEIEERRYADPEFKSSDMAAVAGKRAIEDAGIDAETLDYVIVASNYGDIDIETQTPDFVPSMSARVKHKIGIKNPKCRPYDMIFGCPGWVEAMILATQFIKANLANNILVVGCDKLSGIIDPHDRSALIFSDGAGAVVLCAEENSEKQGVLNYDSSNFAGEELNYLFSGCSLNPNSKKYHRSITMKGRKVYEFALKHVPPAMKSVIDESGTKIEEVKKILIHQANAKMDHAMVQRLYRLYGIKDYSKDVAPMTVQKFGNSSVATVPTMFDIIRKGQLGNHCFNSGDKIIMASVGAGMNINALIYKMP